jgi:CheY-like chemotaxis protein
MKRILVVDDMAVFREPIAASLRLGGFEASCAADGEEALRMTRADHPDLILLDVSMPNMDGMAFLKRLRGDPAIAGTRVILLTALSERSQILAAASLGVTDYLLKSRFRLADLMERISKPSAAPGAAAGTSGDPRAADASSAKPSKETWREKMARVVAEGKQEVPQLLTREQFQQRVEQTFEAKALSGIVAQVMSMASSPRGDMSQLAALISQDAMLSARILQAANSASYTTASAAVTTIPEAILKVGCTVVRNIAATLGVFDSMPEAGPDGFNPIRHWQHSLAVAQLCERFAAACLPDQAGLAYVVGLCHDLGDMFIRTQFGNEYQQVMDLAARTGKTRTQLHWKMFGMTSSQMISAVIKSMGLPDAIREPIEILHSPTRDQSSHPLARLLWIAENYANAAMIASNPNSELSPLSRAWCQPAIGDKRLDPPDVDSLRTQVLSLTVTLARLSRADEASLMVPMFERRAARVWLAREPGICELDPFAPALGSLADVTVRDQLPSANDVREVDGLVVLSTSGAVPGFSALDVDGALARGREAGRALPLLAIACDAEKQGREGQREAQREAHRDTHREAQRDARLWRTGLTLAELSAFVDSLQRNSSAKAAA